MVTENLDNKYNEESEISLKFLISRFIFWSRFLWSKRIIIFGFVIIGGLLGLCYSYLKKPVYTATTTFVLENGEGGSSSLGQYAGIASMMGIDIGGGNGGIFQGDNIIELYKSRTMIAKTLLTPVKYGNEVVLLIDRYIEFNNLRKSWADKPELKNISFVKASSSISPKDMRLRDSIMGVIVLDINKRNLTVSKPDKTLSIIRVDVKAKDEVFAKAFNDQIVQNVNDFYIQTKVKRSENNISILQSKTDSVRAVMNGAIYSAAAVADATPNLNPTRQIQRVAPVQRSQFNAETNKAILGELVKNLEMTKMSMLKETPLIQVIDQPVYPLVKERVGKVKGIAIGIILSFFFIVATLTVLNLIKKVLA